MPVVDPAGNDPHDPPSAPEGVQVMPLIAFLEEGRSRETGWHRNQERRARGLFPQTSLSSQLEPWERQLVRKKSARKCYVCQFIFVMNRHEPLIHFGFLGTR